MAHVYNVTVPSSSITANHSNFIIVIDLSDLGAAFWDSVSNGGGDIRCYKSDGTTQLPREVGSCATASDTGVLYVKYSGTISSSSDNVIQIWTDEGTEPTAGSTYGSESVWSEYDFVIHGQDPTGSIVDSSGNLANGTNSGASLGSGIYGWGESFDLSGSDAITFENFGYSTTTFEGVFQAIVELDATPSGNLSIAGTDNIYLLADDSDTVSGRANTFVGSVFGNGFRTAAPASSAVATTKAAIHTVWYNDAGASPSDLATTYIDGSSAGSTTITSVTGSFSNIASTLLQIGGTPAFFSGPIDGRVQEIRQSAMYRTTAWLADEADNLTSPSTFYTVAAVVGGGGTATPKGPFGHVFTWSLWRSTLIYLGDFAEDATVYIPFNTFSSDDPSASVTVTNLADADIKVHKDGNAVEATTDGASVAIDFDTITGNHLITIDTSADAFYATGSDYMVRVEGITVDGAAVNAWIGIFSIENRFMGNNLSAAQVNAECDTAISDASLATAAALTTVDTEVGQIKAVTDLLPDAGALSSLATASALATVDTEVGNIQTDLSNGTDGLGVIKTAVDAIPTSNPTAAAIADQVWTEAIADHSGTAGSTAEALDGASAPTAAAVADAVWDEAISGHLTAGSTGASLNAAGGSGDPWVTSLPGSYTTGQAGKILADILTDTAELQTNQGDWATATGFATAASLATVDTVVDGIKVVTDNLPDSGALSSLATASALATVDSNVDAILVDTGTTLDAAIAALPTATENADALLNRDMDAVSDTTSRSPLNALRFLRNKWSVAGSTLTVTKEDDTTSAWTATLTSDASANPVTGSDPA